MRKTPVFWAGVLAAWLPASPALAWGPLTHGLVAQRAFAVLAPRMPWLAAHRDAYIWGAVCADIQQAPGVTETSRARAHAAYTVRALWRESRASKDRGAQAFAVGWASHVGADDSFDAYAATTGKAWLTRQSPADTDAAPAALLEWAVDAALLPRSGGALFDVGRAAAVNVGTPAAAPIADMVSRVLGVDVAAYDAWARLVAGTCLGDSDRYLTERARTLRVENWTNEAREAAARQALGDLTPWVTRGVRGAIERARALTENGPDPRHEKETP